MANRKILELQRWAKEELGVELEFEKQYRWLALSTRKKNYVGVTTTGKLDIKGLTGRKRHTPQFLRDLFRKMLEVMKQVSGPDDFASARKKVVQLLSDAQMKLSNGGYSIPELAFHMGLSRDPDSYVKTRKPPQHVRVALQSEGARGGDIISFVKVIGSQGVKATNKAQLAEINVPAYQEFFQNTFAQVLDALGISWAELGGQSKLDAIFRHNV